MCTATAWRGGGGGGVLMRMMLQHQVLQVNHKDYDDNDPDDEKTEEIILLPLSINSQYKRFCKDTHTQTRGPEGPEALT